PEQAPTRRETITRATRLLVVIDPTVGLDEALDAPLVELLQGVEPRPRGERDLVRHPRIGGEDDVLLVALNDGFQLRGEVRTLAVVLHHHPAVLEVVDLELARDGPRVD